MLGQGRVGGQFRHQCHEPCSLVKINGLARVAVAAGWPLQGKAIIDQKFRPVLQKKPDQAVNSF